MAVKLDTSAMESESTRRVRRVLRNMLGTMPFFANLALRMPVVADSKRKTIGANGRNIHFNPEWVATASADAVKEKIAGCVLACGLKHHTRRGNRDYGRWQQASHMVRLPILRREGITDAPGGVEDKTCEQVYETIPEMPPSDDGEEGDDGDQQGDGGAGAAAGSSSQGGGPPGDGQDDQKQSQDPGSGEVMDSPANEERNKQQDNGADPDGGGRPGQGDGQPQEGEASDMSGQATTDPVQAEEQQWDKFLEQASQWAKAQGNMPGHIKQMIDEAHSHAVDWRDMLRRYMLDKAPTDYSWARPNPRYEEADVIVPELFGENMDAIVFAVDTSGSMSEQDLANVWGEVRSAALEMQPKEVIVLQCDHAVQAVDIYPGSELPDRIVAKGRGGTSFIPAIQYIEEHLPRPSVVVYMTDLMGSFGDEPDFPVIWVNTHGKDGAERVPWGEEVIDYQAAAEEEAVA